MLCDKYCENCYYSILVVDPDTEARFVACGYILRTGTKRPSPPGKLCSVRKPLERPKNVSYKYDPEQSKRYHAHVRAVLQGKQRNTITEFMKRTGYDRRDIARQIGVSPETVRKWLSEHQFANWKLLEVIGLPKPPDMPTIKTNPVNRGAG